MGYHFRTSRCRGNDGGTPFQMRELSVQSPDRKVQISGKSDPYQVRAQKDTGGLPLAIEENNGCADGKPQYDNFNKCKAGAFQTEEDIGPEAVQNQLC